MAYNSDMERPTTPLRSSKTQFDSQAALYDTQWSTWSEATLSWMLETAQCQPEYRVLDIATGTGFTALAFAPYVASVVGLDVSPGMLEQARKRADELELTNITFTEGEAEAIAFPDASFDLVTCRIAPHHFLDIKKFLQEAARVLGSGGALVLVDTTVPEDDRGAADWQNAVEVLRDPSHVQNYSPDQWHVMVEEAGLRVQICESPPGGITIPLSDWILKAGCTPEQAAEVRRCFVEAPASARQAFQIQERADNEIFFTWQRVLLKARKG